METQSLDTEAEARIAEYERAVSVHAKAHREHDALLMRKPVEKDAAIRRLMAQQIAGFTAYTAAEKLVEDEPQYRTFLNDLRAADYERMLQLGQVRTQEFRCALALALVQAVAQ